MQSIKEKTADEIELWFNVPKNKNYQASSLGRIKSKERIITRKNGTKQTIKEKILSPAKNNKGYYMVALDGKTYLLHRLIAETFIPNPNNYPVVNHINGIKTDNRYENLEFTTQKDNCIKAWNKGLCENVRDKAYKTKRKISIKTSKMIAQMHISGTIINVFPSIREAERKTGINNRNIGKCCIGKYKTAGGYKWKYLSIKELQSITKKCQELGWLGDD